MILNKLHSGRRAAIWPLLVAILACMLAGLALAVDSALLWQARQELQIVADASALGATLELANDQLLLPSQQAWEEVVQRALQNAQMLAHQHTVLGTPQKLVVESAEENDVLPGYFTPSGFQPDAGPYLNAFAVTARRTRERGNPVGLFFTRLFRLDSANVAASAVAVLDRQVIGFRATGRLAIPLVPVALFSDPTGLDEHSWEAQVDKPLSQGIGYDEYAYDKAHRTWKHRSELGSGDRLPEFLLRLPLATNWKDVNGILLQIGPAQTPAFLRQVESGILETDLADREQQLLLEQDGTLILPELPGPSASVQEKLIQTLWLLQKSGEARVWPLYTSLENDQAVVSGFVAARLAHLETTDEFLQVILQPAVLTTGTALTQVTALDNRYVGKIKLVR